ncbi:Trafficking protein particle complex subunit 6B [Coccomyxa sp. Obi]|nr:Trafficking protein particle complex subunit 6B [Coccomyxa sp. Obi]
MSLVKGRTCSESCMELLSLELVHYYARQNNVPAPAAIEAIGFRVGRQLAERYTANRARLGEPLEVIKFICKEFWAAVFRKQVDNLRTNHRGTFVLKDAAFRWLSKLSVEPLPPGVPAGPNPVAELARDYLVLPCALIRGALVHLGVESTVTADASNLPACDFTINIKSRN